MNEYGEFLAAADATDEQILRAIRRRMSAVEPMVPAAPMWDRAEPAGRPAARRLRPVVRSGFRFAIAPLVLVVVVVAIALAGGMAGRPVAVSTPGGDYLEQTYRLVNPTGARITPDQLELASRLLDGQAGRFGIAPQTVTKIGTDELLVRLPGNYTGGGVALGWPRQVRFVLLPPEIYGTAVTPGTSEVPSKGSVIDPALPAQFTGADLEPDSIVAALDAHTGGSSWLVKFAFRPDKASEFATWTAQHVNDYFAIALDNEVLNAPYIESAVVGGSGEITGNFTQAEATELAASVRFSALGLKLELVEEHQYLAPGSTPHLPVTAPPMTPAMSEQPTQATASGAASPAVSAAASALPSAAASTADN